MGTPMEVAPPPPATALHTRCTSQSTRCTSQSTRCTSQSPTSLDWTPATPTHREHCTLCGYVCLASKSMFRLSMPMLSPKHHSLLQPRLHHPSRRLGGPRGGGMVTSPLPSRGSPTRGQKMGKKGDNWGGDFARRSNVLSAWSCGWGWEAPVGRYLLGREAPVVFCWPLTSNCLMCCPARALALPEHRFPLGGGGAGFHKGC